MSSINNDSINTGFYKCINTLHAISSYANTGSHAQATKRVLASIWFILCFGNVFVCNKTYQLTIGINDRQFFNLVTLQNISSFFKVS